MLPQVGGLRVFDGHTRGDKAPEQQVRFDLNDRSEITERNRGAPIEAYVTKSCRATIDVIVKHRIRSPS